MIDIQDGADKFTVVKDIVPPDYFFNRIKSGVNAIDEVFGEGIVPGSSFTLSAPPGCGKTTFILQVLENLSKAGYKVGVCSSEESIYQVAYTCKRLDVKNVHVCNESNLEKILTYMSEFDILVIDSFQGLSTNKKLSGSKFEKHAIYNIVKTAKKTNCAVGIVCQQTKAGKLRGTNIIPHTVDVNIIITRDEDNHELRIISTSKNRFGGTKDMEFTMGNRGYEFERWHLPTSKSTPKNVKKKLEKEEIKKQILKINGPITLKDVYNLTDKNITKANLIIKELTIEGLINKQGRGNAATWQIVENQTA